MLRCISPSLATKDTGTRLGMTQDRVIFRCQSCPERAIVFPAEVDASVYAPDRTCRS